MPLPGRPLPGAPLPLSAPARGLLALRPGPAAHVRALCPPPHTTASRSSFFSGHDAACARKVPVPVCVRHLDASFAGASPSTRSMIAGLASPRCPAAHARPRPARTPCPHASCARAPRHAHLCRPVSFIVFRILVQYSGRRYVYGMCLCSQSP